MIGKDLQSTAMSDSLPNYVSPIAICTFSLDTNLLVGRSFMDRFELQWKDVVKFFTKSEIFQIENDPITMRDWVFERDNNTRIQVLKKYFSSRKYIFVVETQMYRIEAGNKQEFQVLVSVKYQHHIRNLYHMQCSYGWGGLGSQHAGHQT